MGTTLTGTTPQDTYDSLIKVTDNGPLSGTAKYLSDGLGNDSVLALSTSAAGVGTTTMARKFNIDGGSITSDTPTLRISSTDGSGTRKFGIEFYSNSGADVRGKLLADNSGKVYLDDNGGGGIVLQANGGTGNVGIADAAPLTKLSVGGSGESAALAAAITFTDGNSGSSRNWTIANGISASGISQIGALTFSRSTALGGNPLTAGVEIARFSANGLSFNGDTAAANALDDYEEGTWTMGVSFGGASVGVTYSTNTGTYTKIGRQVTVNGLISLTSKGSSTGEARLTGLPFTIGGVNGNYSTAGIYAVNISFANQLQAFGSAATQLITLAEITEAGVTSNLTNADFANNSEMMVSLTYYV